MPFSTLQQSGSAVGADELTAAEELWVQTGNGGVLELAETAAPSNEANVGKVYMKSDNVLYFQDENGNETPITAGSSVPGLYVVGPTGSGADYECDGTDDDVEINAAITAGNNDGGASVFVLPGTYLLDEPVQMRSYVKLIGAGIGVTIIKAEDDYTPTVTNPQSGSSILLSYNNDVIENCEVRGITWDANAQNMDPAVPGVGASHRAIWIREAVNLWFHYNEVKNPWHWCVFFHFGDQIHCSHNRILAGWRTFDAALYPNGRQDGINMCATNSWITHNYIDTYGIQETGTQGSGDDAISLRQDVGDDFLTGSDNVVVAHNHIRSGSRGIVTHVADQTCKNQKIHDNVIEIASNSGILVLRTSNAGVFTDLDIHNNTIESAGNGDEEAAGIAIQDVPGSGTMFQGVSITENRVYGTVETTGSLAGYGIVVKATGDDLNIVGNRVSGIAGGRGITVNIGGHQVTNFHVDGNTVVQPNASSSGIVIDGATIGTVNGNKVNGPGSANGSAIRLIGRAAMTPQYVTVADNVIKGWANGIIEEASGSTPDNNTITNNVFDTVTTRHTVVGSATRVFGDNGTNWVTNKTVSPLASDGAALGTSALMFSDLFLASGGVINFNNGDVTVTHSADLLNIAGGGVQVSQLGVGIAPGTLFHVNGDASNIYVGNAYLMDSTAQAAATGARIALGGKINSGGDQQAFGTVAGLKTNSTNDNYDGYLSFATRANGAAMTERMTLNSAGTLTLPLDSTTVPGVLVGTGSNASTYLSFAAGRSMVGWDAALGNAAYTAGSSKGHTFYVNGTNGTHLSGTRIFDILQAGNVGIGVTAVGTSGVKVLGIGNGTEPSTSPADMVQLYSVDLSAGNATLGLRTETAVVTESVTSDRTLSVRINGTTYKICLKS